MHGIVGKGSHVFGIARTLDISATSTRAGVTVEMQSCNTWQLQTHTMQKITRWQRRHEAVSEEFNDDRGEAKNWRENRHCPAQIRNFLF